jgi:CheY-like chemotaxis protein
VRADLEGIRDVVQRAAALTNQLLIFSRKQEPQPKRINLNDLVHHTEKLLRRLIGEDIALHTSLDPDLGWIEADPGHIEQVIMNLAVNARDAMPYGGQLVLETANVDDAACECSSHSGAHVMLSIGDTGTGMTEGIRSHIFEPFFTTKEAGKGTGLGLATVLGIVEQCEAHIRVESELGLGTKFAICFPRVPDSDPDAAEQERITVYPRGTETILVVEDEEVVRSLACRVLERQGYNVLTAHDPDESVLLTARHTGDIDLLITDVVMPGMGGAELATWIAEARPLTKVLFMSGYTEDTIADRGITATDVAFLQKPFTPSALAAKVRELLDEA